MSDIDTRPASELNDEELAERQAEDGRVTMERVNASMSNVFIQRLEEFGPVNVYVIHPIKERRKQ